MGCGRTCSSRRAFPGAARHTKPPRVKRRRQHAVSPYSSLPALRAPHYDGKVIRWYVLRDPDYGIECLVNDQGGRCPRLNPYGSAIGASYERGRRGRPVGPRARRALLGVHRPRVGADRDPRVSLRTPSSCAASAAPVTKSGPARLPVCGGRRARHAVRFGAPSRTGPRAGEATKGMRPEGA